MTTTTFAPTATSVFTFQATLDKVLHTIIIPWNVFRRNWYFQVYDQSDTLIVSAPLVGSLLPPALGVNLVGGYFDTSTVYYYPSSQIFVVLP